MSAGEVLQAARAAGVELRVDGDALILEAAAPPPADVIDLLSRHKPALVALLRPGNDGWTAQDWQAFFDEVAAIDADMRRMTKASAACRRLMTIPGVGQLTALAFVAAIDDPSRIRRSRDVGAYLGLVPRRYQSGEVDYIGGISKCGDRRVRTLLYEAANVMLTRYKGQLKLKDWAFAIAKRSTMRKARVALARRLAIIMHAMLRDGTEFVAA